MATSLQTNIRSSLNWNYTNPNSLGDTVNAGSITFSDVLSNGTTAEKADLIYAVAGTIAASGTLTIDLSGSVADVFGNTISMARVKAVIVELTTDTAADYLVFGNSGSNPIGLWFGAVTHTEQIRNGGVMVHYCQDATGWPVVNSASDKILITNHDSVNIATYQLCIIGASA